MEKARVNIFELCGTNYEIGYHLGKIAINYPQFIEMQKCPPGTFTEKRAKEMTEMFDQYCPGLNEELQGFADAIGETRLQMVYYAMTYLTPGCSLLAVLPKLTANGHVMVARNYEFSHKMDDFSFCKTKVKGKYDHMGGSVMQFGRSEGINECGLMVGQTSCGMPVGNMEIMRKPAITGLQFWAVIRSLLENCKDVNEALQSLMDMPIAYNINLILADKFGRAALFETLDGKKAVQEIDGTTTKQYIHSTNHAHLPEIAEIEPLAMEHSVCRYEFIKNYMDHTNQLTDKNLKDLLLSEYPTGLCCHWYDEFFGTIKSMVFDVTLGKVDICWGGIATNGWKTYSLDADMQVENFMVDIEVKHPTFEFNRLI
ncbi:C45 family autoproteolytic acyltransferase/hydolase [Tepidibacter hydrothermalis]|uniref:C45 family autoproteolytic acyltransferase/hydrolase n=1 Tax=Tepidibacter hydrothermalis TaxID=3036126 RepID=A0ABY8EDA0_9FIRM|nr:C45 family peptidase [Tepidibacter hydrothermalis]WFD10911.1 C45 family autoproteolytic acyltransferase/hydrolase [Tepidibacter hydrothermalis]